MKRWPIHPKIFCLCELLQNGTNFKTKVFLCEKINSAVIFSEMDFQSVFKSFSIKTSFVGTTFFILRKRFTSGAQSRIEKNS
ncbi:hypothetical protein CH380_14575 [Leptospira adleri]|uniref:Uncharacterized protein n=1 Tax=Leptospira adleri TaxID=2023186 RepID=A0A2M9YLG0_9LEPT|nr:hypothetical protein CH380_14575 [Leptospira adleri]PJZ60149.1 hypothetical protein CH376_19925 [Leptospira adleri]